MVNKPENPPAFPLVVGTPSDQWGMQNDGMTLRDYFAAAALNGMLSDHCTILAAAPGSLANMAGSAYEYADAMLKERQRDQA